jgi:MerR family copper efflux transcriptional regulator
MKTSPELLQIGEAADHVGLSIRTLRHWEEIGLVRPTARSKGGFRLYSRTDLERIRVVKAMKPVGLTLEEMAELLELVELARDPAHLEEHARDDLSEGLEAYAVRTEERIQRLVRDMSDATTLLEGINAGIRRCRTRARPGNDEPSPR